MNTRWAAAARPARRGAGARMGRAGRHSRSRDINVSQVFAGQKVGVKQVDEHVWLVTFMHYDLGYFDDETGRLEPIDNPSWSETVTRVSGPPASG
jgi:hypothetical protein